jgi:dTDP-glucose 4,6-dehydratase
MSTVLITGGSGFIGHHLVRYFLDQTDLSVVNVDKLTYAAVTGPGDVSHVDGRYSFEQIDICDGPGFRQVVATHQPAAIMHLAAETHVDRSLDAPAQFFRTNVEGSFNVIEAATSYWNTLPAGEAEKFRLLMVSTDEVFGALGASGQFDENSAYLPNSPYAATKAASDHLARAWHRSLGLPAIVCHCSNNYGPRQTPDKLIPKIITNAIRAEAIPIYGDGSQVRDWVWVEDHAKGLAAALARGEPGEHYLFGGSGEASNLELARTICDLLDHQNPNPKIGPHRQLIKMVADRPGHDQRYAVDWHKAERDLDWRPTVAMESGLEDTIRWYMANRDWWTERLGDHQMDDRLGLARSEPTHTETPPK